WRWNQCPAAAPRSAWCSPPPVAPPAGDDRRRPRVRRADPLGEARPRSCYPRPVTQEMATALYTDVETMLAAHGAGGAMRPFAHEGYSGAALSYVEGGATRFVLKRIAGEPDWLRRALRDERCREARLAASPFAAPPPDGALARPQVSLVLRRLAEMHAAFWEAGPGGIGCGPVPLEHWLRILEP